MFSFFAPQYAGTHAGIAHTLMTSKTLPDLGKIAVALVGSSAAAVGLLLALGPSVRTRALAAGASTLLMCLASMSFPAAASFAVLFVDTAALHPSRWRFSLMPGLSGTVILFAFAALKIKLLQWLRASAVPHTLADGNKDS